MRLIRLGIGMGAIALTLLVAVRLSRVPLMAFFDLPSLIFLSGLTLGGLLMNYDPLTVLSAYWHAALGKPVPDRAYRRRLLRVLDRSYQLLWGGGVLGALVGVITMLSNLSAPASVGVGMAVSLLTLFYAVVVAELIVRGFRHNLLAVEDEEDDEANPSPQHSRQMPMTGLAVLFLLLSLGGYVMFAS